MCQSPLEMSPQGITFILINTYYSALVWLTIKVTACWWVNTYCPLKGSLFPQIWQFYTQPNRVASDPVPF